MIQPLNRFLDPSLDSSLSMYWVTALQMSHQGWAEKGHGHQPAGNAPPNAGQDVFSLLCHKGASLANFQIVVDQDPQFVALYAKLITLDMLVHGVILPKVLDFTFLLVCSSHVPFLKTVSFESFQSSGTSPHCHDFSNKQKKTLKVIFPET